MIYLWVFLFACAMWALMAFAATVREAVFARREGGEPHGVSIVPYLLPPVVLTGVAYVIDITRSPMGTWVVVGVHALLGVLAGINALRGRAVLRREA